jgi:enolase
VERRSAEARRRLDEEDGQGLAAVTRRLGKRLNLIGYDFFTASATRLEPGIALRAANGVLVKGDQNGTLDTIVLVRLARPIVNWSIPNKA